MSSTSDMMLQDVRIAHPHANMGHDLLQTCSHTFHAGEVIVITGRNGAGKSTLLQTIAGLQQMTAGTITIGNEPLWLTGKRRHAAKLNKAAIMKIALAMQQVEQQWFADTVEKELLYALKPYLARGEAYQHKIDEALLDSGLDASLLERDPWTLSRGQQRRLALACISITKPDWILLDEPSSGLDANGKEMLLHYLKRMKQAGVGIIIVSHELTIWKPIIDRNWTLNQGVLTDTTSTINRFSESIDDMAEQIKQIRADKKHSRAEQQQLIEQMVGLQPNEADRCNSDSNNDLLSLSSNQQTAEAQKKQLLTKWDPRAIIISYLLLSTTILLQKNLITIIVATIVVLLLIWPIRTVLIQHIAIIRMMFIISLIFTIVAAIQLHTLTINGDAIMITGQRLYKLLLVLMLGLPIMSLVSPFRLNRAFEQSFGWLSKYGVPIAAIGLLMTLIFRFIPLLIEEWQRFSKIVRLRGKIIAKEGRLPLTALIPMLIPYLRSIIYRAEQLAAALELRGYQTVNTKPHFGYRLTLQRQDYQLCAIFMLASILLIAVDFY